MSIVIEEAEYYKCDQCGGKQLVKDKDRVWFHLYISNDDQRIDICSTVCLKGRRKWLDYKSKRLGKKPVPPIVNVGY